MTVYVDNMFARADVQNGPTVVRGVWCHMMADSHDELEAMARQLGLKPSWIQYPGTWREHYDVTKSMRAAAVRRGAVELPIDKTWLDFLMRRRAIEQGVPEGQLPPPIVVEVQQQPTLPGL